MSSWVALRTEDGDDWANSSPSDVLTVAESVVSTFPNVEGRLGITLRPTVQGYPQTLAQLDRIGSFVVLLNGVRDRPWAKLAYQFAHELCHVLMDPLTWQQNDRFAWLEEALAEAASLFALRAMARAWQTAPPHPHWQSYHTQLASFADRRISNPAHARPDMRMLEWLESKQPELEAQFSVYPPAPLQREYNTIIARALLPVFEADPRTWRAVRYLHFRGRSEVVEIGDLLGRWRAACPTEDEAFIQHLANALLGTS
jgi:hypothetical protein